jgi:hypothetical protein
MTDVRFEDVEVIWWMLSMDGDSKIMRKGTADVGMTGTNLYLSTLAPRSLDDPS